MTDVSSVRIYFIRAASIQSVGVLYLHWHCQH